MPDPAPFWPLDEARDRALTDGAGCVIEAFRNRLDARSGPGVWISLAKPESLRARAQELDAIAARGHALALHGVPFAVKDNIDVAGIATTAGAREFAYLPRPAAPALTR